MKLLKKPIITILIFSLMLSFTLPIYSFNFNLRIKNSSRNLFPIIINQLLDINNESEDEIPEDEIPEDEIPEDEIPESEIPEEVIQKINDEFDNADNDVSLWERIWSSINLIKTIKDVYGNIDEEYEFNSSIVANKNAKPRTYTESREIAKLCCVPSAKDGLGPIAIGDATLKENGIDTEVTFIALQGTELTDGQATGIKEDILSGFDLGNDYLRTVVDLFQDEDVIPRDKPVVLAGISLGGMVAQQLLGENEVTNLFTTANKNFYIKNIVCFGSPLLDPESRTMNISKDGLTTEEYTVTVRRLCEKADIVPHLSASQILKPNDWDELDKVEKVVLKGNYLTFVGAHSVGYATSNCWTDYDVLGYEDGDRTITIDTLTYYNADK